MSGEPSQSAANLTPVGLPISSMALCVQGLFASERLAQYEPLQRDLSELSNLRPRRLAGVYRLPVPVDPVLSKKAGQPVIAVEVIDTLRIASGLNVVADRFAVDMISVTNRRFVANIPAVTYTAASTRQEAQCRTFAVAIMNVLASDSRQRVVSDQHIAVAGDATSFNSYK